VGDVKKSPIYVTGLNPDGKILVGGIFRMKDEQGVPLDFSHDICREKGWVIDYMELLCDAWLNDCLKFDSVVRELEMLGGSCVEIWKQAGSVWISEFLKSSGSLSQNPIDEFCREMLSIKRRFQSISGKEKGYRKSLLTIRCK
jgi:hypothetical protein